MRKESNQLELWEKEIGVVDVKDLVTEEEVVKYSAPLRIADLEEKVKRYSARPGIPRMLITTLIRYSKKPESELTTLDAIKLYRSIPKKGETYYTLKKFSRFHNLFFGESQYKILEKYLNITQ